MESASALVDGWAGEWSLAPVQVVPIVLGAFLYALRARRLGPRLPLWRRLCFAGGIVLVLLAVVSPIDPVAEDGLMSVHMLQHALIGNLGPLLILLGVTGPVLAPALRLPWVMRLRVLTNPLVAFPLWTIGLIVWYLPGVFDLAIENAPLHAAQHACFFVLGCLMWAPVVEPLPGPEWFGTGPKIIYLLSFWIVGLTFGNIMWFSGTVFYERYLTTAPLWGVSALQDQANAGTIFMLEHGLPALIAISVLFFRLAQESALSRRLLEAGVDPVRVRRAIRFGSGDALAARYGVPTRTRPGID
jgi:cytochrome c oxidase assembly factor CtaG